ncbi:NapC/NirT family cytochrome c [Aeromonas hydrophila]|uniref:NapC/NirT family cytochrome c n=1 Tax=Aeromonas hydrophila TaxID=644 RepID=UPI0035BA929F
MILTRQRMAVLFAAGVLVGTLLLAAAQSLLHKRATTEFCIWCHRMEAAYQEYQRASHFSHVSGGRAAGRDCHLAPAPRAQRLAKVRASLDV